MVSAGGSHHTWQRSSASAVTTEGMAAVLLVLAAALARLDGLEARASNEGSRKFHNHEEGPYYGLLQVESALIPYDLCVCVSISHLLTVG